MTDGKYPAGPFHHLIVLVDGTRASAQAVDASIALALSLGAELTALVLLETETLVQLLDNKFLSKAEMESLQVDLEENGRRLLSEVVDAGRERGVEIRTAIVRGNSARTLPREISARGADLVVLGAFDARKALHDLLARQRLEIVTHASCPVLVVR